jgi:TPR repeat protein
MLEYSATNCVKKEMRYTMKTDKKKEKRIVAQWTQDAKTGNVEAYKHLFFYYARKKTCWQKLMEQMLKLRRKLKIVGKNSVTREKQTRLRGKYMRKALGWARKQQEQGYALMPEQAYYLAMDIIYDPKQTDKTTARELFEYAIDGGLASAAFQLGHCYSLGKGFEKDREKAKKMYMKASEMGSYLAKVVLDNEMF